MFAKIYYVVRLPQVGCSADHPLQYLILLTVLSVLWYLTSALTASFLVHLGNAQGFFSLCLDGVRK